MVLLTDTTKGSTVKFFYNFLAMFGLFTAINFLPAEGFSFDWWVGTLSGGIMLIGIEGTARKVKDGQNK